MEIKTKYSIGDEVWFNLGTEMSCGDISRIDITIEKGLIEIRYFVDCGPSFVFDESKLYPTKELLVSP